MIEQLFNNDKNNIAKTSMEEIQQRQEFIMGPKVDFFNKYLQKVNNNLKKRNLAPIFTVSNKKKIVNDKKVEEIIDKKHKKDYYLSLESSNDIPDNERYTNVELYMENSVKKFLNNINQAQSSRSGMSKTEANSEISK